VVKANSFITVARFFSGKFFAFNRGANEQNDDQKIVIEGNLDLVNELQDIISELDIDWEEPLSRITGDVVAHEISRVAHDAGKVIKKAGEIFERDLDESLNRVTDFFFKGRSPFSRNNSGLRPEDFSKERGKEAASSKLDQNAFEKELGEIQTLQEKAEQKLDSLQKESAGKESKIAG